jgi:lipid kinase YegS
MDERKALLILHGKQAMNEEVREAVAARRELGWQLDVRVTWEGGDAQRIVTEALAAGYPTLIAGGGDGTLRDVAEAMATAKTESSLVLMPLGTANDFAVAAGVPLTPGEALALLDQPARPVDLGGVDDHIFLNMATGGFGSNVTANTSEDLKRMLGGVAYFLTGLTRFAEVHSSFTRFTGPDFAWEGEVLALGVGNGRQAGGGHELCPEAWVDDGLLDVCIVPAASDAMGTLSTFLSGSINGVQSVAVTARLPWLEVEAPEGLDLNLDGEPMETHKSRFQALPAAIRLHLPAQCRLFKTG